MDNSKALFEREKMRDALNNIGHNLCCDLVKSLENTRADDSLLREFAGAISADGQSCVMINAGYDHRISFYFKDGPAGTIDMFSYHRLPLESGMGVEILKTKGVPDVLSNHDSPLRETFRRALDKMRHRLCMNPYDRNELNDAAAYMVSGLVSGLVFGRR